MFKRLYVSFCQWLNQPIKNKHVRVGIPFFLFMAIGLVVIRECATVRYQFRKVKTLTKEEVESLGLNVNKPQKTLEEFYEEYKKMDIDNWENVRGPRLFEEETSE